MAGRRCGAIRRDVRPRGHRGGIYPLLRAAMCVFVRDLIVYGVISRHDKGRPAVYATFSSYDEVAHHSGLERADTLEALRKLDQQFGRIERARRYAARPVRDRRPLRPRPDAGSDLHPAQRLRPRRPGRALARRRAGDGGRRRRRAAIDGRQRARRGDRARRQKRTKNDVSDREVVVLGSGNLGLVYLMEEKRRLTLEEIERAPPAPDPGAARAPARRLPARPVGRARARSCSARRACATSPTTGSRATTRSRRSRRPPPQHLRRTDGFAHVADIMVNSFYDPQLDEGCAFEELISFHGGMGGPQTRPFILHPVELPSRPRSRSSARRLCTTCSPAGAPAAGRRIGGSDGAMPKFLDVLAADADQEACASGTPAPLGLRRPGAWSSSSTPSSCARCRPSSRRRAGCATSASPRGSSSASALLVVGLTWVLGMTSTIVEPGARAAASSPTSPRPAVSLARSATACRAPPARSSSCSRCSCSAS